jgi:hypothetical protein
VTGPQAKSGPEAIRATARHLLACGAAGDEPLRRAAAVGEPIPVLGADRRHHSWFVPVTVGDRLVAFFQLLPDSTLMRFSSFVRQPGRFDGCPPADQWIDPEGIAARAEPARSVGETAGEPFLSFDRTPDRIAWAVPLAAPTGATRIVYVAGESVYEGAPEGTIG